MQAFLTSIARIGFALLLTCSLAEAAAPAAIPADGHPWGQWRGPSRDGQLNGPDWPESVDSKHLKELWRFALGPGYSTPIVSSNAVYVTETRDAKTEHVTALERDTGKQLWTTEWAGAISVPFFAKANGDWIRATPLLDGDSLYVPGIRDLLVCLNANTGEIRWKVDFVETFKSSVPTFGFVCSPIVLGDFLYVQAGGGFVKLNKHSGQVEWRVLADGGGMNGSAFSSPYFANLAGKDQLLVQAREKLYGVDPQSGAVYWSNEIPAFRGMNIVTPTVYKDSLFTSSYGAGSYLLAVSSAGDNLQVKETWKNKLQGYMTSPVIIGDDVYLHLRNQRFASIHLPTGKENWVTEPFGKYWSLVAQRNRILALDETGDLRLIDASPKRYTELSARHLSDDSTWAHLVVADDQVLVRDLKGLTVYRWKSPGQ